MKQFNLDEYIKNPNRKIVTRGGNRSIRIISVDRHCHDFPIVALMGNEGYESVMSYPKNGRFYSCRESKYDLFFAPEKKSGWINLYKIDSSISPGPLTYNTEEEAKSAVGGSSDYVTTIKIEWEE